MKIEANGKESISREMYKGIKGMKRRKRMRIWGKNERNRERTSKAKYVNPREMEEIKEKHMRNQKRVEFS